MVETPNPLEPADPPDQQGGGGGTPQPESPDPAAEALVADPPEAHSGGG